jgi:signal transduction histidine kinase
MILQRLFLSAKASMAMRFLLGLLVAAGLLAGTATWNWSMTADAFGQISLGKITVLHDATLVTGPDAGSLLESAASSVTLPHRIEDHNASFAHYQLELKVADRPSGTSRMALCVPRWSSNANVWINGQNLLSQAQERLDVRGITRPAFVPLPVDLGPGVHQLDIRLRTLMGTFPGLSEVWVGPHNVLAHQCGLLQDVQVGIRLGGLMLMAFITFVSFFVFASQRDALSLGFAMVGVSWCLQNAVTLGWLGTHGESSWITWFMVTRPLPGIAGFFVGLRLLNVQSRSLYWGLLGLIVLAYAVLAWLPVADWQTWLVSIGLFLAPANLVLGFSLMWHAAAKSRFLSDYAFALTLFFGVWANSLDLARAKSLVPYSVLSMTYWIAPLLALAIGLLVIERLVRYLRYKKEAAVQLQRELADQRVVLATTNHALSQQREKLLLSEERQRLVSDMHDGLGSQLVSASALLKSGHRQDALALEVSGLIDHALLDLRSMLDVFSNNKNADTQGSQDTVSVLLGMLRHRLAPVFRSQDITFDWQSEALPHDFLEGDRERLQLLRLLQEAFSNIIKHAKAHSIALRSHVSDSVIVFEVSDDGQGIEASQATSGKPPGHGLTSMADRAARIGAQLLIESNAQGTCVRLIFQR